MALHGALVLVVGPSGVGKDALIGAAKSALGDNRRFLFPRRAVTRETMAEIEDHDSIGATVFAVQRQRGAYALSWQAHGLWYGVPASIDAAIAAGQIVICNVSRQIIAEAMGKYEHCVVLLITADPALRTQRLAGRGRESADDIAARLKHEGEAVPKGAIVIDNSGTLEAGAAAFVAVLRDIARN